MPLRRPGRVRHLYASFFAIQILSKHSSVKDKGEDPPEIAVHFRREWLNNDLSSGFCPGFCPIG
jgi:hypothetical protein